MEFIDTHCHIHSTDYPLAVSEVIESARLAGVNKLLCVGTSLDDSQIAVEFAQKHKNIWSSIGIHPHESKDFIIDDGVNSEKYNDFKSLVKRPKVVAVGECGLDYFYSHSPKEAQAALLKLQIELALGHNLPLIFHVRDAYEDFWPIFDSYKGIQGVIHSFSASEKELAEILKRRLYVGLNGIMTFSKNQAQLEAARVLPLNRLVLETDSPYLTPVPYRGRINEPKNVRITAEFLANLRKERIDQLAAASTQNAQKLFGI
jgi:TatD DNase family protein